MTLNKNQVDSLNFITKYLDFLAVKFSKYLVNLSGGAYIKVSLSPVVRVSLDTVKAA